jgi:site-specific recombinase XerD
MRGPTRGERLSRQALRQKFRNACKPLGAERLRELSIHDGRHSFISHAIAAGCTLPEVRDAAGHADLSTTSLYSHTLDDDGTPRKVFDFSESA